MAEGRLHSHFPYRTITETHTITPVPGIGTGFIRLVPLIKDGACLLPLQYTPERIAELQENTYIFQTQYQQNPSVMDSDIIKRAWFVRESLDVMMQRRFQQVYISCDPALKGGKDSDRWAFIVAGVFESRLYILDCVAKRLDYPTARDTLIQIESHYCSIFENLANGLRPIILMENTVGGASLIQDLQASAPYLRLLPVQPVGAKEERIRLSTGAMQTGAVIFPMNSDEAPWLHDFENELIG